MINITHEEMDLFKKDWLLFTDTVDFLLGANIGVGETRSVYECGFDITAVIKIERPTPKFGIVFDNVIEYSLWNDIIAMPEYAKFLAPCVRISGGGRILVMKKTTPVTKDQLPKKIPFFLGDTHINNWGMFNKKVVCHDYANHKLYSKMARDKFVKPVWR